MLSTKLRAKNNEIFPESKPSAAITNSLKCAAKSCGIYAERTENWFPTANTLYVFGSKTLIATALNWILKNSLWTQWRRRWNWLLKTVLIHCGFLRKVSGRQPKFLLTELKRRFGFCRLSMKRMNRLSQNDFLIRHWKNLFGTDVTITAILLPTEITRLKSWVRITPEINRNRRFWPVFGLTIDRQR